MKNLRKDTDELSQDNFYKESLGDIIFILIVLGIQLAIAGSVFYLALLHKS